MPGCAAPPARRRPSPSRRRAHEPGHAGVGGSVTWSRPPDSVHATQVSTVPKHRSRGRGRGRRCRGGRPAWWPSCSGPGAGPGPGAPGTSPPCAGPASRCPGPTGSPVARSHRIGRRPLVGDADRLARRRRGRRRRGPPPSPRRRARRASSSTKPGAGVDGRKGRRAMADTVASGATTLARTLLVPTSITRTLMRRPAGAAVTGSRRGCRPTRTSTR